MAKSLLLSVHQLVDFLLRQGDIDTRVYNRSSMQEGSRIHSAYQSSQDDGYISEYPLKTTIIVDEVEVTLQGRADGIIKGKNRYIIDEIKSTVIDLKEFRDSQLEWHLGQAKCYAYMFMKEQHLDSIGIRLTYIRQGEEKDKMIDDYVFLYEEIEQYVISLVEDYIAFYNIIFRNLENRTKTAGELEFPYDKYRDGQKELASLVYKVATKGGRLFVEAPTGIGKTMSTLFPCVKTFKDDENSKIFYLTAKSSGKLLAMNAIRIMKEKGLSVNEIMITAKEKICFEKGKNCNPDECPYAKGYYNRIQSVLTNTLLTESTFDQQTIMKIAEENYLCPFEFQLDLSLFCDIIVCDYNYLFDPTAYLRRYFDTDSTSFLALVDEAHNLVDRSREMYSAELTYQTFIEAKKSLRGVKDTQIKNLFRKLTKLYKGYEFLEEGINVVDCFPSEFLKTFRQAFDKIQEISKEKHHLVTKELTNLLLEINSFLKISEYFSPRYIAYIMKNGEEINFKLFCKDASIFLRDITNELKSVTYFSATMSPMDYYIDTLGGEKLTDPAILLDSPFDRNNLLCIVAPKISIKYKNREASYIEVGNYIKSFISAKKGNYFIYSPSYEYMNRLLQEIQLDSDINVFVQQKDMTEFDKIDFLNNFTENPTETNLGFLVIGGVFSEGIDLVSDRLIGAVVIGVGMPRINFESDQIASFYDEQGESGYEYAYLNPGMNKVMQAVGRVIRSETDKGAVMLIDERYMYRSYKALFRDEWKDYKVALTSDDVKYYVSKFFKN